MSLKDIFVIFDGIAVVYRRDIHFDHTHDNSAISEDLLRATQKLVRACLEEFVTNYEELLR